MPTRLPNLSKACLPLLLVACLFHFTGSYSQDPTITTVDPSRNAVNAPRNANVSVTFSQAMNTATASGDAIKIQGSQTGTRTLAGKGTFSGGGTNTISFAPAADFKSGEQVQVSVTANAKNTAGTALAKPQVFNFTIAAAAAPASFMAEPKIPVAGKTFSIKSADLDGDGDVDIATANQNTNTIAILLNDGKSHFSVSQEVEVELLGNYATFQEIFELGDLDGDGDVDIMTANYESENISLRFNDGNGHFSGTANISLDMAPTTLTVGDFDNDGDTDLATGSANVSRASLYFNNGTGIFTIIKPIPVSYAPNQLFTADFNQDGNLDLAQQGYNKDHHEVAIFSGDGKGNFAPISSITVDGGGLFVKNADFDQDGDIDIYASGAIYLNDGHGNFPNKVGFPTWTPITDMADFDGDSDIDLAAVNSDSSIVLLFNNGQGSFPVQLQTNAGKSPHSICSADFDGDGDLDIATGNHYFTESNGVVILLNQLPTVSVSLPAKNFCAGATFKIAFAAETSFNSDNMFTTQLSDASGSFSNPIPVGSLTATKSGFINVTIPANTPAGNDYRIRMVSSNPKVVGKDVVGKDNGSNLTISSDCATLTATNPVANKVNAPTNRNVSLTFSKAMNAGTASNAAIQIRGAQTGTRTVTGKGSFSGAGTHTITFDPAEGFKAGERVSVSVTNAAQGTMNEPLKKTQVFDFIAATAPATGSFTLTQRVGEASFGFWSADFDQDGDLDVVTSYYDEHTENHENSGLYMGYNDGSGKFTTSRLSVGGPFESGQLGMADLDNDGDMDLLQNQYGYLSLFFNEGSGKEFTTQEIQITDTYDSAYSLSDLDGDGDVDLAIAGTSDGNIHVWLNNGTGQFSSASVVARGGLFIADVDNDGDKDLVGSSTEWGKIVFYLNDGSATFTAAPAISLGAPVFDLDMADLNGDGALDIVAASYTESGVLKISFWLNNGSGGFSTKTDLTDSDNFCLGDFDGNGSLDIVVAAANSVTMHLNDGTGHFVAKKQRVNGTQQADGDFLGILRAGDYDGDGDLDLATNSQYGVTVLLNGPLPPPCKAIGMILREYWAGLPVWARGVSSIPVNTPPTLATQLTSMETASNQAENFGQRLRGYICAPQSGSYTFFIASDNEGELWLSTDDQPANKVRIAFLTGYTKPRQWDKYATQRSASILLVANKQYYIEVLHQETASEDNLAVGWRTPSMGSASAPVVIPGNVLSPVKAPNTPINFAATAVSPTQVSLVWTNRVDTYDGYFVVIERATAASGPYSVVDTMGNNYGYTDNALQGNTLYYYRLFAVNPNGFSPYATDTTTTPADKCTAAGSVRWEYWANVPGKSVASIPVDRPPTSVDQLTVLRTRANTADNYGQRLRGYLCAPTTGQYTFFIQGDDQGELYLSTGSNPLFKQRIAWVAGAWNWTSQPSQQSVAIDLVAGQSYYLEVLHKEATGADVVRVGWRTPEMVANAEPVIIPGSVLSTFINPVVTPKVLRAVASSESEIRVQWEYEAANQGIFAVERSISPTGPFTKVLETDGYVDGATDSQLQANTTYYYRVYTYLSGASPYSAIVSATTQACSATGTIYREVWTNVPGKLVSSIPLNTAPNFTAQLTSFNTPAGYGDNYGQRMRGYLCAPATGSYTFFLQGDDQAQLYLSSNDDPANKIKLITVQGALNWVGQPTPIVLEAGKRYYVEAQHKENTGGDFLRVGWRTPAMAANATPVIIPGSVLSPFVPSAARQAVNVEERLPSLLLKAYPNPTAGTTTVEFTAVESGWLGVHLYSLQGKLLKQLFGQEVEAGSTYQQSLDAALLPEGLYLLRLVNGQHLATQKLVIVR